MKNALIAWNVLLTLLVGYLFFQPQSQSTAPAEVATTDSTEVADTLVETEIKNAPVYYVNTDSLFQRYDMYKDMEKQIIAKEASLKKRLEREAQTFEKEYLELKEKAPFMTQSQGEVAQQKLMAKQQGLLKMEQDLGARLAKQETEMVRKIKLSLNNYLKTFKAERGYQFVLGKSEIGGVLYADPKLDLTDEVVAGLNATYHEEKETK